MTTLAEATQIVLSRFDTLWASATPVVYDNEVYSGIATAWTRLTIVELVAEQTSIGAVGSRMFRRQAAAIATVFAPQNTGAKAANALADAARTIFEGVSVSGVHFGATTIRTLPPDGGWHLVSAQTPFTYHEMR